MRSILLGLCLLGAPVAAAEGSPSVPADLPVELTTPDIVLDATPLLDVRVVSTCTERGTGSVLEPGIWMSEQSAVASARYQQSLRTQLNQYMMEKKTAAASPRPSVFWWVVGGAALGALGAATAIHYL